LFARRVNFLTQHNLTQNDYISNEGRIRYTNCFCLLFTVIPKQHYSTGAFYARMVEGDGGQLCTSEVSLTRHR